MLCKDINIIQRNAYFFFKSNVMRNSLIYRGNLPVLSGQFDPNQNCILSSYVINFIVCLNLSYI